MGFAQPKSMMANGTIVFSRFVKLDPTANHKVIQCAAVNDFIFGIAGDEARTAPTPDVGITPYQAAQVGEMIDVHPNTAECLLAIGTGGCSAGDRLTSDSTGQGVKNPRTGHPPRIGAIALTAAASGELALVQVCIFDSSNASAT
jgi:hypothetical protein